MGWFTGGEGGFTLALETTCGIGFVSTVVDDDDDVVGSEMDDNSFVSGFILLLILAAAGAVAATAVTWPARSLGA